MQFEQLRCSQPIIKAEVFGKKTNFATCADVARGTAKNLRLAARGEYQAQQHFHRGALAGAVRPQETEHLTPSHLQSEVSDRHLAAEDFA